MTRLFLRFFVGILVILALASVVQVYVMWNGASSRNAEVFKQINFGGLRIAQNQISNATPAEFENVLDRIRDSFEFPVEHVRFGSSEEDRLLQQRLASGEPEFVANGAGISFNGNREALILGPFPNWYLPRQSLVLTGIGIVVSVAAIAIALLLQPIVKQLRGVERAAIEIADGNLSARVDTNSNALPIAEAFNTMADQTESLLNSQRELLQAVSHELRTPLARIRFATELVQVAQTEEQRARRLGSIDKSTQQLDQLVGELLNYVRLDSASSESCFESVDLEQVCEDALESYAWLYPKVRFERSFPCSIRVEADRNSLTRAIGNLVSNAAKHAQSVVSVGFHQSENWITIRVDDDGPGINALEREKMFEPFVRLDNAEGEGAGLGLAIVKRIMTHHHGNVHALTNDHGGARFEINLPRSSY